MLDTLNLEKYNVRMFSINTKENTNSGPFFIDLFAKISFLVLIYFL